MEKYDLENIGGRLKYYIEVVLQESINSFSIKTDFGNKSKTITDAIDSNNISPKISQRITWGIPDFPNKWILFKEGNTPDTNHNWIAAKRLTYKDYLKLINEIAELKSTIANQDKLISDKSEGKNLKKI